MKFPLYLLAAAVAASAFSLAAQNHPVSDLGAALKRTEAAQLQLQQYKLDNDMDGLVPPALQHEISTIKDALAALADAVLVNTAASPDAKQLETRFVEMLHANPPEVNEVYDETKPAQLDHIYGDSIWVTVTRPRPSLLLVDLRFSIACGQDSMLLAYEPRQGQWRQTLRWQSPDYKEISGAFGDIFSYAVVPATNGWRVAVAHGSPWCTSNSSAFYIDVLKPERGNTSSAVLFHKKAYYRRDLDTAMKTVSGGFQLRVTAESTDTEVFDHPVLYRYRVAGDTVERVQPIAVNGRDFVDVWLELPWADAARFSSPAALEQLKAIHSKLALFSHAEHKPYFMASYGPVRGCTDSLRHFQVELGGGWWSDYDSNPKPAKKLYVQIEQGANSFTMLSASPTLDARCTGHNIMPQQ